MKMQRSRVAVWLAGMLALGLAAGSARANNLQITNVTVKPRDTTTAWVQFDISWENSWRHANINHDAAWVFFKVLPDGRSAWEHVTLEGDLPPLNGTTSRERIWGWSKPREATNATRKEGTG